MKFSQTKPQVKSMNKSYYDLHYTVIKNRNEKELVDDDDEYENDKNNFDDFTTPNHYIGSKNDKERLKSREMVSRMSHFKQLVVYKG